MKAIVFDFDDTLTDFSFATTKAEAFISVLLAKKYNLNSIELLRGINKYRKRFSSSVKKPSLPRHNSRELWFSKLFADYNINQSPRIWESNYWSIVNKNTRLFYGVKAFLKSIKIKKFLLSDSDGKKVFKLERIKLLGIREYFDNILITDDIGINKPSIKVFKNLVELMKIEPSECIIVGDEPFLDLKTAKDMGFKTVWTVQAWPNTKKYDFVDYKISNILELGRLLELKRLIR